MASMDVKAYFKGKKVVLTRIGLIGRGVGDAAFLAEAGADLLVVDDAPQEVMQPSVDKLKEYSNIRFKFGKYDLEDFRDCDLVVKGAGMALDSPEIAEAKAHDISVRMSADLLVELSGCRTIGITGTRGKSTTTHMVGEILKAAGEKVLLGGNVRGVSNLQLLREATSEHVLVLELDSWQCQGFGEAGISPTIAVFTTFFQDHLNYYKNDLGAYLADKANIFLNQGEEDTFVLGKQCAPIIIERYGEDIDARMKVAGAEDLPDTWALKVPGEHNRYNAALALAASRSFGVDDVVSRKALEAFSGVPGRLEYLGERTGVKVYNDNNATTPDATIVALKAFEGVPITLIMGGADKGIDMNKLLTAIEKSETQVVLLAGSGTERIDEAFAGVPVHDTLASAVGDAFAKTPVGGVILFSPAFASFGMFTNEYDRNDQFIDLVRKMGVVK